MLCTQLKTSARAHLTTDLLGAPCVEVMLVGGCDPGQACGLTVEAARELLEDLEMALVRYRVLVLEGRIRG